MFWAIGPVDVLGSLGVVCKLLPGPAPANPGHQHAVEFANVVIELDLGVFDPLGWVKKVLLVDQVQFIAIESWIMGDVLVKEYDDTFDVVSAVPTALRLPRCETGDPESTGEIEVNQDD